MKKKIILNKNKNYKKRFAIARSLFLLYRKAKHFHAYPNLTKNKFKKS